MPASTDGHIPGTPYRGLGTELYQEGHRSIPPDLRNNAKNVSRECQLSLVFGRNRASCMVPNRGLNSMRSRITSNFDDTSFDNDEDLWINGWVRFNGSGRLFNSGNTKTFLRYLLTFVIRYSFFFFKKKVWFKFSLQSLVHYFFSRLYFNIINAQLFHRCNNSSSSCKDIHSPLNRPYTIKQAFDKDLF